MNYLRLFVVMAAAMTAGVGIADAGQANDEQDKQNAILEKQWAELCKGKSQTEPACGSKTLTLDEKWLVLRAACERSPEKDKAHCTEFRTSQGAVLTYDVVSKAWRAEWESALRELEFDVAGVPTLRLPRGAAKPLKIVATNISPLSYSAAAGTPTEKDLEVISDLKTWLSTAGAVIGAGLTTTALFTAPPPPPPPAPSPSAPTDSFSILLGKPSKPVPPKPPVCAVSVPDLRQVADVVAVRNKSLEDAGRALKTMNGALASLEEARDQFIAKSQEAEAGSVTFDGFGKSNEGAAKTAYDTFDNDLKNFKAKSDELAGCQPLMTAYTNLLAAPASLAAISGLAGIVESYECGNADLQATIHKNSRDLAASVISVCTATEIEAAMKVQKGAMQPLIDRLQNAAKVEETFWKAVGAVGTGKKDILSGAATLDRRVKAAELHTWNKQLIRELIVTRPNPELAWNKVQTHSMVVKVDTPYQKDLVLTQPVDSKYEYKLEPNTGQILGFSIGAVVYTPLYESTWTAVTAPDGTSKVIGETKREGRSGSLAAFLNYRFAQHWPNKSPVQPTLDFGFGFDSDNPSFFLGGGIEVLRAARMSIGWSPQRVPKLAEGQEVNVTKVSGNDDIRTTKGFEAKNWYISLSFALDSLSLFNSK